MVGFLQDPRFMVGMGMLAGSTPQDSLRNAMSMAGLVQQQRAAQAQAQQRQQQMEMEREKLDLLKQGEGREQQAFGQKNDFTKELYQPFAALQPKFLGGQPGSGGSAMPAGMEGRDLGRAGKSDRALPTGAEGTPFGRMMLDMSPQEKNALAAGGAFTAEQIAGPAMKARHEAALVPPSSDDIKEYGFALQQGYQGTFKEYLEDIKRAGAQNINLGPTGIDYGKPEAGLAWSRNPDGTVKIDERGAPIAVPYQGGSAYQEQQEAARAAEAQEQREQTTGSVVVQDIDRALKTIDEAVLPTTGVVGDALSHIGGTAARDVRGLLDTIKANAGFRELQSMRDSSPTGGALGQVTVREIEFLQAVIGNLEQSQTKDQLVDNMRRVKNVYLDIIHGPGKGPPREGLGFEQQQNSPDRSAIEQEMRRRGLIQ